MTTATETKTDPVPSWPLHVDLDEGRYIQIGCVACKDTSDACMTIGTRVYEVILKCNECDAVYCGWFI